MTKTADDVEESARALEDGWTEPQPDKASFTDFPAPLRGVDGCDDLRVVFPSWFSH